MQDLVFRNSQSYIKLIQWVATCLNLKGPTVLLHPAFHFRKKYNRKEILISRTEVASVASVVDSTRKV